MNLKAKIKRNNFHSSFSEILKQHKIKINKNGLTSVQENFQHFLKKLDKMFKSKTIYIDHYLL